MTAKQLKDYLTLHCGDEDVIHFKAYHDNSYYKLMSIDEAKEDVPYSDIKKDDPILMLEEIDWYNMEDYRYSKVKIGSWIICMALGLLFWYLVFWGLYSFLLTRLPEKKVEFRYTVGLLEHGRGF